MNESTKKLVKALENPFVAFFAIFASMVIVGTALPAYWIFLFSVAWSYVLSDIIINGFIVGGKGIAQIPLAGDSLSKHKGHAYTAFFIGIIFSTVLASVISDLILQFMKSNGEWFVNVFGWSLLACLAVFADLEARFYKRD
jgi:hypothetical protein